MASSLEFASRMAKPPITSLDSVKGPSVTASFPPDLRTRAPRALGRQPSVATSHPAFIPSSTKLPILIISSCDGGTPFSGLLYRLKNRIVLSFVSGSDLNWRCSSVFVNPVLLLRRMKRPEIDTLQTVIFCQLPSPENGLPPGWGRNPPGQTTGELRSRRLPLRPRGWGIAWPIPVPLPST